MDPATAQETGIKILKDPQFQALREDLAKHPGFMSLLPAEDARTLHALFAGEAPEAQWPVPGDWKLRLHEGIVKQRLSHHLPEVNLQDLARPLTDGQPPNPLDLNGIRPGSLILTSFQGVSGTFICTLAFIMKDQETGRYYAATAGHCLLPPTARATHGNDADWDPDQTTVLVCVNGCLFGGQLSFFNADLRGLGSVVYARQKSITPSLPGDIGNDFGLVQVHPFWYTTFDDVQPRMAMWDGPVDINGFEGLGTPLVHYGNGITSGSFAATKGRVGVSLNDGHSFTWQASADVMPGDSGSPFSHAAPVLGGDVLRGEDALGVLTHGLAPQGVPLPGLAFGTPLHRGVMMAFFDAGISLELVPAGTTLNKPPTASFILSCTGLACDFDGTGSSDADGTIATYEWDFGDGNAGTGATPSHTYTTSDAYEVTLTVRDDGGAVSDPEAQSHTATNLDPTADFAFACTDLACSFDGSKSTDAEGTIASYSWDFGDGNTGTGVTASHTYNTGSIYPVRLTVTDNAGGTGSQIQNVTVTDPNQAPAASLTSSCKGMKCSFDGTGSRDADGTIASYEWDFGDGNTSTGATPTHKYDSPGTYTVQLQVVDDDGAGDSHATNISVPGSGT